MIKPIGCGLLAVCLLTLPVQAADVDKLLPDDAGAVACINIRQILDSALVKKHGVGPAQAALKNESIAGVLTAAGFDPLRDLTSATLVFPADHDPARALVIIHGKFDRERIAAQVADLRRAKDSKLEVVTVDHQAVYAAASPDGGKAYIAILDGQTLIAATDRAPIAEAIAKHAGKRVVKISSFLAKMIEQENQNESLWLVVPDGKFLARGKLAADDKVKEVVGRIDFLRLGISVGDSVNFKAMMGAKSADDATALKKDFDGGLESAKGIIVLVGDQRPELAPLGQILDTIKVKNLGKVILLDAAASGSILNKMIENAVRPKWGRP